MNRFEEIVWGGLVADAATMGMHWIYNQKRIAKIANGKPEFFDCELANYTPEEGESEKIPYFYVHEGKKAGDLSHYGEQLLVMLKALAKKNGTFSRRTFEDVFYQFFGPDGEWVGYIDRPTRVTLYNYMKRERDAHDIIDESKEEFCGDTSDDQLPTITKLPALIALYFDKDNFEEMVEAGARTTNNNDTAVSFAQVYGAMLKAAIETRDRMAVIEAARVAAAPYPEISDIIERALSMVDKPHNEASLHFGISCHLPYSLPHDIVLLYNCDNYVDAIRMNILAAGDNCGRSVMIGAIYAALYGQGDNGLPQEWIDKLTKKQEIGTLIAQIDCE